MIAYDYIAFYLILIIFMVSIVALAWFTEHPRTLPTLKDFIDPFVVNPPEVTQTGIMIMSAGNVTHGQYVRISKDTKDCMHLAEVQVWDPKKSRNHAVNKDVTMSSYWGAPYNATNLVNNNTGLYDIAHTKCTDAPWMMIDLGASVPIGSIVIINRSDCCQWRVIDALVEVLDANKQVVYTSEKIKTSSPVLTLFPPNTSFQTGDSNNLDITGEWPSVMLSKSSGRWKAPIHRPDFTIITLGNNQFGFRFPDDPKPLNATASLGIDGVAKKLDFGKNLVWDR